MDVKITKLGDELMALTTAEALELQNYLESKGLKPVQATVVASTEPVEEEVKESANVNVILTKSGSLLKLAKVLMPVTGKSAMQIKELTATLPAVIIEGIPREVGKAKISEFSNELDPNDFTFELQDA